MRIAIPIILCVLLRWTALADGPSLTVLQSLGSHTNTVNGPALQLPLPAFIGYPGVASNQLLRIDSTFGPINIELLPGAAPLTVANFLNYVHDGDFTSNLVHRSMPDFVIQSGGFILDGNNLVPVPTDAAVTNEFGLSNLRGTLAMAKLDGDPNSATSGWFINLTDNSANLDFQNGGFTVFARTIGASMDVVDTIAAVPTYDASPYLGGAFTDLPLTTNSLVVSALVLVHSVTNLTLYPLEGSNLDAVLQVTVSNRNPGLLQASVTNGVLAVLPLPNQAGTGSVEVTVTDTHGVVQQSLLEMTVLWDYEGWRGQSFAPTNATNQVVSGMAADPESDGLKNLAEFFHASLPEVVDTNPVEFMWEPGATNAVLRLRYPQRRWMQGVSACVTGSSNLVDWVVKPSTVLSVTDLDAERVQVLCEVTPALSSDTAEAFRLQIEPAEPP